jgi:hypothetical protein
VPGHDDPVGAEGVRRPDDAAEVSRAGRAVEHEAEETPAGRDPAEVVPGHLDHRHQLRGVLGLLA